MADKHVRCPLCGAKMIKKKGKYGAFYACPRYPVCNGTGSSRMHSVTDGLVNDIADTLCMDTSDLESSFHSNMSDMINEALTKTTIEELLLNNR